MTVQPTAHLVPSAHHLPPAINFHPVDEDVPICEAHIQGVCVKASSCPLHHYPMPYLWQVYTGVDQQTWESLVQESERIEEMYCQPQRDEGSVEMRRLSTPSYGTVLPSGGQKEIGENMQALKYKTQWRWYFQEGVHWKSFEMAGQEKLVDSPPQAVLERKFLHGQQVYRFHVEKKGGCKAQVVLIDFRLGSMISPTTQSRWNLRRRPLFLSSSLISAGISLPYPELNFHPYASIVPDNWVPLDSSREYELVPMNPDNMEFHLIKSEFVKSLPQGRDVHDIFRVQNAFLWNKYASKKLHMELRNIPTNERQLFHGTAEDTVVQSIFLQNFDWRMCGKNATLFGRGSYFATDAQYSDRYTGSKGDCTKLRWMFLARVLVGRSIQGSKDLVRPPPLDASRPHGELYDSCVDSVQRPRLYVIFDADQCYPEYVVSYKLQAGKAR